MTQIGEFTRTRSGFIGRVHTLSLDFEIVLVAADQDGTRNAPEYRIHANSDDGPEIGAGWRRSTEKAGEYVSIQLDDPSFPQPVYAKLFQNGADKTSWSLHWSRRRARRERE